MSKELQALIFCVSLIAAAYGIAFLIGFIKAIRKGEFKEKMYNTIASLRWRLYNKKYKK